MSDKKKIYNIILKAAIAAGFILVFWFIWYYHYREDKAGQIVLKSRYTFSVRIDSNGNVVNGEEDSDSVDHTLADAFGNLKIDEIGDVWIREFTAQYTQKYLAWSKQLKKITLNKTQILNESENTVLISFSAGMNEHDSENFASWNGVLDDGRLSCEWVVSFYIDNHYDGTATIYVKSIDTPEDYGIAQYNQNKKNNVDKVDETQKKSLTNYEIKNNTLSHSYLFVGQEGIGKKLFAKELAKMALCLSNANGFKKTVSDQEENVINNDNTNVIGNDNCSSCVKFDSSNNPDFVLIEPDGNSIKIAQIREMQENVYTKPIVSRKKVFIINDSDKMTEEAQNSLLKTLEEPPEYIIIILITANENKLLNTIKSRCLKISFNNLETNDLISYINSVQKMQVPSENLLKMCNGSIGKLMKANENLEEYNAVESTTNNFLNGKIPNVVKMLSQFEILYKSKEIINDLLDYMIVIIYEYINKSKDYRAKFLNLIAIIENTKNRIVLNNNYDMCIDNLVLKLWEETVEK